MGFVSTFDHVKHGQERASSRTHLKAIASQRYAMNFLHQNLQECVSRLYMVIPELEG